MLYFSLIDILFLFVGVLLGFIISTIASASGQRAHCDDCIIKEIIKNEKSKENS